MFNRSNNVALAYNCKLMEDAGLKWWDGDDYTIGGVSFSWYKEKTFYHPYEGTYGSLGDIEEVHYTIYPATDFIKSKKNKSFTKLLLGLLWSM